MSEAALPGFDGASCVPSHSAAENKHRRGRQAGLRCIAIAFPQIRSMGGRRSSSSSSDHCTGYAVDFIVPRWNAAAGRELGWRIARWVQANRKALRGEYIIWDVKSGTRLPTTSGGPTSTPTGLKATESEGILGTN